MMLALRAALLAAALIPASAALAQSPPAQAASRPAEQALAGLDRQIADALAAWNVPGVAVSVVQDGRVVLSRGYGVRDPDRQAPMTDDTIFPIASMSKAFTSFGVGLLVDEGRVSFDAPVAQYIAGLSLEDPAATQGLTLRDMLSHRSGLPRHDAVWYHNEGLTREALLGRVAHLDFSQPLRARFQYNNIMFILAGLAVDRVAGEPWERFTERRIFRPLGMGRTMFSPERAAADPNHTRGREILNGRAVTVPLFRNTAILNPAGGVYSTAADLAQWVQVHLSGGQYQGRRIIQPATLADLHRTAMPLGATVRDPELIPIGYGLGWFTNNFRGRPMVQHGGNLPGSSTMVALLPEQSLGVVVLVNQGGSELRDALAWTILDRLLGETGKDWLGEALARKRAGEAAEVSARRNRGGSRVEGTRLDHPLGAYAGTYVHPGYGRIVISQQGERLVAGYNDDSSPLTHWHYEVFDASTTDPENILLDSRLQFVSDPHGRVAGLQVAMEPAVAPAAFERQPEARLSDPAFLARLVGTYELAGNRIVIAAVGNRLTWTSPGGQPADLLPAIGGEFVHARRRDARIAFVLGPAGQATGLRFIDTSGVYDAARIP